MEEEPEEELRLPPAVKETRQIPPEVRAIVDARDNLTCRVCGRHLGIERRALHHVIFGGDARGMGGRRRHDPAEIMTVCWLPGDGGCHDKLHGRKSYYQPYALRVLRSRGTTVLQLIRWEARQRATNGRSGKKN